MGVPSTIADLSTTAASNSPAGTDTVTSTTGPDDYIRALSAIVKTVSNEAVARLPSGTILDFAGTSAPTGFLPCDGSAVSRSTYSALFAALSTTWGVGDGSTTFNVPDLRGRTVVGAGTGAGLTARTLGQQAIGEETHVLTAAELAAHNHAITDPGHAHGITDPGHSHSTGTQVARPTTGSGALYNALDGGVPGSSGTSTAGTGITISTATTGISTVNSGSNTAHNNMQPSAVVNKIIKT